jgi:hypothetical protein
MPASNASNGIRRAATAAGNSGSIAKATTRFVFGAWRERGLMKQSQTQELAALIRTHRPEVAPEMAASFALSLVRAAKELGRIAERQCSEEMSEREAARVERRERKLETLVRVRCDKLRIHATFSGDPRGFVVKLHFGPDPKRQPGNTWGGPETGWGIG